MTGLNAADNVDTLLMALAEAFAANPLVSCVSDVVREVGEEGVDNT